MKRFQITSAGILLFPALAAMGASPVTTDAWDITQGTVILNHSSFDQEIGQGYDARDVFGGTFTAFEIERGKIVFDDNSPNGFVDFIEWRTASPVVIKSFNMFYESDDSGASTTRRCLGQFTLYERASPADPWVLLYSANAPLGGSLLTSSVSAFAATDYRAEFIRASTNEIEYTGARIVELDGFTVPEPAAISLLGLPMLAMLLRRSRRFQ